MRIIVTGGSGFIGSHLIEELVAHGHQVFSVDVRDPLSKVKGVTHTTGDICDHETLTKTFASFKPDAVVHLAALPSIQQSIKEPHVSLRTNVAGTYSVIEAARSSGASRVVFASSAAVYGKTTEEMKGKPISESVALQPLNPYALAKKMGEEFMRMAADEKLWKSIDAVSLRFFNVYGPRKRRDSPYRTAIETFTEVWKEGKPFPIFGDGTQRRDFIFVKDVVRALRLAAERTEKFKGEIINIAYGKNFSVIDAANFIGGETHPKDFLPARPGEIKESLADTSKAKKLLGWSAEVSFKDGLQELKK